MKKKIALICYEKQEEYTEECICYIQHLLIPDEVELEFYLVKNEYGEVYAFQEGMECSDAEIKIYFSNDVFFVNTGLLLDILHCFEFDESIGAVGIDGWKENCIDIICNERANIISGEMEQQKHDGTFGENGEVNFLEVTAIEGTVIATSKDFSWIDTSLAEYAYPIVLHSVLLKKKGYRVVSLVNTKRQYMKAGIEKEIYSMPQSLFDQVKKYCFGDYEFPDKRLYMPESGLVAVDDIKWSLILGNYDYVFSPKKVDFMRYSEKEKDEIVEELKRNHCNCAITRDFSRTMARACFEMNIPYISWTFDTPLQTLYREEAKLPTNYIFSFDKKMIEQIKEIDASIRMYPVSLAVNMDRNAGLVISEEDEEKYTCDISMVGNLYEKNFYRLSCVPNCSKELLQEIEGQWFQKVYGNWRIKDSIHNYLSDWCIDEIAKAAKVNAKEQLWMENRFYEEVSLARELTCRERIGALNRIAEKYSVVLYSDSDTSELKNVICRKGINYYYETPKVFHLSKININITLRSIESGVIQRIYDVMAVGGFVMTNAQPEISDYFTIGEELVVFHDFDEMMELIDFYLTHEAERVRIAMKGYQRVKKDYTYSVVLEKIIDQAFHETNS